MRDLLRGFISNKCGINETNESASDESDNSDDIDSDDYTCGTGICETNEDSLFNKQTYK